MSRIIDPDTGAIAGYIDDGLTGDVTPADLQDPFDGARDLAAGTAGAEVATVTPATIAQLLEQRAMPFLEWAGALLKNTQFDGAADEDPSAPILLAILGAATSAEAMAVQEMTPVETLCPKTPGAHSPLLRFTAATPLKSTFDEGPPCFAVVSYTVVATGDEGKTSIGARSVQAVILKHLWEGWLPFEGILTRRLKPTRAGFYPMNLESGG